jgi:PhnB protein
VCGELLICVENQQFATHTLYKRAIGAGAISESEPKDQFWGDRTATVKDSFGNTWSIASHKEDVTSQEMAKRMAALVR